MYIVLVHRPNYESKKCKMDGEIRFFSVLTPHISLIMLTCSSCHDSSFFLWNFSDKLGFQHLLQTPVTTASVTVDLALQWD